MLHVFVKRAVMSNAGQGAPASTGTTELELITAKVDELQRRADALTGALARSKNTRLIIVIAFLVFVLWAGWRFYALAKMIRSEEYQRTLTAELQKSLEGNQDLIQREAEHFVNGVTPVVTTAFAKQSEKDMPLFMQTIDEQRQSLMNSLAERMTDKVEGHHRELVRRHEKLIEEEFPSVQNPEIRDRMMNNVCNALDRLIKKYYVDELKRELLAMSTSWDDFPLADLPVEKEQARRKELLGEALYGELLDLVAIKLTRHRTGHTVAE